MILNNAGKRLCQYGFISKFNSVQVPTITQEVARVRLRPVPFTLRETYHIDTRTPKSGNSEIPTELATKLASEGLSRITKLEYFGYDDKIGEFEIQGLTAQQLKTYPISEYSCEYSEISNFHYFNLSVDGIYSYVQVGLVEDFESGELYVGAYFDVYFENDNIQQHFQPDANEGMVMVNVYFTNDSNITYRQNTIYETVETEHNIVSKTVTEDQFSFEGSTATKTNGEFVLSVLGGFAINSETTNYYPIYPEYNPDGTIIPDELSPLTPIV